MINKCNHELKIIIIVLRKFKQKITGDYIKNAIKIKKK